MNDNGCIECVVTGSMPTQNDGTAWTDITNIRTDLSGIYGLRCRITGKWYIGKTKNTFSKRWRRYELLTCRRQPKIYNALVKYGYESFDKVILEVCEPIDAVLNDREQFWIRFYNSYHGGYNLTDGGSGDFGRTNLRKKMSVDHREKLRKAHIGKTHVPSTILKMSKSASARWNRPESEDLKRRLSVERTGKKKTASQIEKTSGQNNGMFGKCWITDGVNNSTVVITDGIPTGWRRGRTF